MKDLKLVYQAVSKEQAEVELDNLERNGEKIILSLSSLGERTGINSLLTSGTQIALER